MCPEGNAVWLVRSGRSRLVITFTPPVSVLVTIKPCASEYVNLWKSVFSVARLTRKERPIAGPQQLRLADLLSQSVESLPVRCVFKKTGDPIVHGNGRRGDGRSDQKRANIVAGE